MRLVRRTRIVIPLQNSNAFLTHSRLPTSHLAGRRTFNMPLRHITPLLIDDILSSFANLATLSLASNEIETVELLANKRAVNHSPARNRRLPNVIAMLQARL